MGRISVNGQAPRAGTDRKAQTYWISAHARELIKEHLVGGSTGTSVEVAMIVTAELAKSFDVDFVVESSDIMTSVYGDSEARNPQKQAGLIKVLIAAAARYHAEHPEEFEGL